MKKLKFALIGLAALALAAGTGKTLLNYAFPKRTATYEYAIENNIKPKIAGVLEKKLKPEPEDNDKKFIKIISAYPEKLQEACVNSDILDNRNISEKELENTQRATLNGIINPREIYAVLANGSGPQNPEKYSQTNFVYSMLNVMSFYKLLKNNNVSDTNISLFIYNPINMDVFKTETYNSLLEKKLTTIEHGKKVISKIPLSKILPSEKDEIQIDGTATKNNFIKRIRTLPSDYNDTIYIMFSDPAGKGGGILGGVPDRNQSHIEFNKEIFTNSDLIDAIKSQNLKYDKMFIFQNSANSSNLASALHKTTCYNSFVLPYSERISNCPKNVFAIISANTSKLDNEIFTLDFISKLQENPDQSIKNIMDTLNMTRKGDLYLPETYYYNLTKIAAEESPLFYKPFFN